MKRNSKWLAALLITGCAGAWAGQSARAELCDVERTTIRTYLPGAYEAYIEGRPVEVTRTTTIQKAPWLKHRKMNQARWVVETSEPTAVRESRLEPVAEKWIEQRACPVAERRVFYSQPVTVREAPLAPVGERITTTRYRKMSKSCISAREGHHGVKKSLKRGAKRTGYAIRNAAERTGETLEHVGERIADVFVDRTPDDAVIVEPASTDLSRTGPWYLNPAVDYDNPYR
ncbi:MAG TPA: hypothetical protein VNQ90_14025 [Chthoniobacteraceae bacterium]|nr:hypothetical protein [Chthoniobacteraceae bacterium]